jgi:acyl-CoA oxidase
MLAFRESSLLGHAVRRLSKRVAEGMDSFTAFHALAPHLQALALAHVERGVYESFRKAVQGVEDEALASVLGRLCDLYGLSCMEEDMSWFLENGVLEASKARAVRKEVLALCAELRPDAVALVDGFGIPQHLLASPIAHGEVPGGGQVA